MREMCVYVGYPIYQRAYVCRMPLFRLTGNICDASRSQRKKWRTYVRLICDDIFGEPVSVVAAAAVFVVVVVVRIH